MSNSVRAHEISESPAVKAAWYQDRFVIGGAIFVAFVLVLGLWQFWNFPAGLTRAEMDAAAVAGNFSLLNLIQHFGASVGQLINLPWTILEWLSIRAFGFTEFAFRLPAALLMIATAVLIALFLRRFTRPGFGLVAGFIAITSVMWLGLARTGTAAALTVFLLWLILVAAQAVLLTDKSTWCGTIWKIVIGAGLALLIYSPGGIYLTLMLTICGALHPKARLLILKMKPWKIAVGILGGLVLLAPLLLGIVDQSMHGQFGLLQTLVLWGQGVWSLDNLAAVGAALVGLGGGLVGGLVTPILSMVGLILAILGLLKLIMAFSSARAQLILALLVGTLIMAVYDPNQVFLLFVPLVLAMAVGVETLISEWYGLFPRNPYARVAAALPLVILLGSLGLTNVARFNAAQNYDATVVFQYDQSFTAVRSSVDHAKGRAKVIVPESQLDFYRAFAKRTAKTYPGLTISDHVSGQIDAKNPTKMIVLAGVGGRVTSLPQQIVTGSRAENAVLLRVY